MSILNVIETFVLFCLREALIDHYFLMTDGSLSVCVPYWCLSARYHGLLTVNDSPSENNVAEVRV